MTPVPKPRVITSIAGAIPIGVRLVAIREDRASGLTLRRWVSVNARGA